MTTPAEQEAKWAVKVEIATADTLPSISPHRCWVCSGPIPETRPRVTVYCVTCGIGCCSRAIEPCSEACAIRYTEGGMEARDDCCSGSGVPE